MTFAPILDAPAHIHVHVIAATLALGLGPVALYRRRRDTVHRVVGAAWVFAMVVTALSAFTIHSFGLIGPFSPIHLLAVLALWALWQGMTHVRARRFAAHGAVMRSLYWNGLCLAGLFTFLPGRLVNRALFSNEPRFGLIVIALGAATLLVIALREHLPRRRAGGGKGAPSPARGGRIFSLVKARQLR